MLRSAHTVYLRVLCYLRTNRDYFLYGINLTVFVTETECVYCAVRTGPLNTIYVSLWNPSRYATYQVNYTYYMEHNIDLF
jgi:hypothetical protein